MEGVVYGLKRMVGAARVMHSENVCELMDAMAEDARDAEARRQARQQPQSTVVAGPTYAAASTTTGSGTEHRVKEDTRLPCRTAA